MATRKPTKKYELLTARYDGVDEEGKARRYVQGEMVPLTENEYAAFGDKFGAEESRKPSFKAPTGQQPQSPAANPQVGTKSDSPANAG